MAAVEFALIAPIFFALTFGIVVYGSYFMTRIAVTQAAAEGARASVAGSSAAERTTYAANSANAVLGSYGGLVSAANLAVTSSNSPAIASAYTVTISYDFTSFGLSGLSAFLPLPPTHTVITSTAAFGGYQ